MHRVMLSALLALALLGLGVPAPGADAARRLITPEDLLKFAFLSNATISHDGKLVAFVVSRADLKDDGYHANIWIAAADGSSVTQLTRGDHDGSPAWSPDDRTLAFTRGHGVPPQIFAIDPAGGEARQITSLAGGVTEFSWSHDGTRFALTSIAKDARPPAAVDWRALGAKPPSKWKTSDIRRPAWPRYQLNGDGYVANKHPHIWTIGADGKNPKALTNGADGETGPDWSPDDASIAYNSTPLSDPEGDRGAMFVVPAAGGAPMKIPVAHYGAFEQTWSHDGTHVFYQYISRHDNSARPALATVKVDGSDDRTLAPENTFDFGDSIISDTKENGTGCGVATSQGTFITEITISGDNLVAQIGGAPGAPYARVDPNRNNTGEILDCSVSRSEDSIAFTALDATHLSEVFVAGRDGVRHRLTHFNDEITDSLLLAGAAQRSAPLRPGESIPYYLLRPPNAVPGKKYPVVLDIHGGPHGAFGNSFFHEFQVLAARGYIVVYANPRGSSSYDYAYESELDGNWGNALFSDEMAVMDDVAGRPDVDMSRAVVSGGSYGGYATLWMISHTNRFRAALAERPVSDLFTEMLTADFAAPLAFDGPAGTPRAWGPPVQAYTALWQQSPLAHVTDVHTPLMLLHGDTDTRTPIDETLQEYEALKMLGRPVTLVQFPREDHDLSRTGEPIHRIERLHIMLDWFDRYTR
jgi:dipeptidyl aminopeptidase/acylaminoacyl peptidase